MKQFSMTVYQRIDDNDTSLTTSFQLNEEKAKDMGTIVGTALNSILEKIRLQRTLGAKILYLNKPVNFTIDCDGINIDSKLLDAGVLGARKSFSTTFTVSASPVRQKKFAIKVWAAVCMLLQELKVKTINEVLAEKDHEIKMLNFVKKVEEIAENNELPAKVDNLVLTMPIVDNKKVEKPENKVKRTPRVKKNPKVAKPVENKA